jgi:tetratricopeptide (TPR) repeat protein
VNTIHTRARKCSACGANVPAGEARCGFCGAPLPEDAPETQPAAQAVVTGEEDIVDYYALLGMNPLQEPDVLETRRGVLRAQETLLLNEYIDAEERHKLSDSIEIGGWILTTARARSVYDAILLSLRDGSFTAAHVTALSELQREAAQELGLLGDDTPPAELLQQGNGYLAMNMYSEAAQVLQRAVEALPDSAEAHYRYATALLGSDPLAAGSHEMRQAARSFQSAAALEPRLRDAPSLQALCQGLLARQDGDTAQAEAELRRALQMNPELSAASRALAALALSQERYGEVFSFCRRVLLQDPRDEQSYLLLAAACWRTNQRDHARDAASRAARLRGEGWNAERVLREILG